jgi:hypothetical protein
LREVEKRSSRRRCGSRRADRRRRPVARHEAARGLRHRRLDLHGLDALDGEALQQRVRGEAGADADHRRAPRARVDGERQRAGEHHGDLVAAAIRLGLAAQVDGAVGLAVGADAGDRA